MSDKKRRQSMPYLIFVAPSIILIAFSLSSYICNNSIILSLLTAIFLFCVNKIANLKGNTKKIKYPLLAMVYFLAYDVILTFFLGTNALAFCLASLFFQKAKKHCGDDIAIITYHVFGMIFFLTQAIINYFLNNVFHANILIYQIIFFTAISAIHNYFFQQIAKRNNYILTHI